jgi:cullin-associated NEDD8-dissociated protein 1
MAAPAMAARAARRGAGSGRAGPQRPFDHPATPRAPQIASKDKDFRYMATSDLLNELQKPTFKVDVDMGRRLGVAVLTQLEDASGDISGLAVKWCAAIAAARRRPPRQSRARGLTAAPLPRSLAILVRKVDEQRALDIVQSLCGEVISGKKEQQREVASIGLKAVIAEIPSGPLAAKATTQIAHTMLQGAGKQVIRQRTR